MFDLFCIPSLKDYVTRKKPHIQDEQSATSAIPKEEMPLKKDNRLYKCENWVVDPKIRFSNRKAELIVELGGHTATLYHRLVLCFFQPREVFEHKK